MKKILLFMLPIMALSLASCEKNNRNELPDDHVIQFEDPNFLEALLVVRDVYYYDETGDYVEYLMDVDANKDGKITVNEAKNVRALEVNHLPDDSYLIGYGIESMPEIKYFTALEYLDCWGNQLTSLDLSNNTALRYLYCSYNQLTSLDLSNNTALTELYCSYNPQLSKIILNKNHMIDEYYIQDIIEEYGDIIEYME